MPSFDAEFVQRRRHVREGAVAEVATPGSYVYTDLGTITDSGGGRVQVRGLHHPVDDLPAEYEVRIDGAVQLDAADPAQRGQIETLIFALQTAVANGEAVGWTGGLPTEVQVKQAAVVEWTARPRPGVSVKATNR